MTNCGQYSDPLTTQRTFLAIETGKLKQVEGDKLLKISSVKFAVMGNDGDKIIQMHRHIHINIQWWMETG